MAMDDPFDTQKARRQELLAALGPAVQHAANNMLTVLGGTADILRRTAADEAGAKRADRVTDATRRLETLIRAYVTLARRPVPDDEPADAAQLLGRLAPLIELSLPRGTRLELETAPDLPRLRLEWAALDAALLTMLRDEAPRLKPLLRLVLQPSPEGATLRIEGLPDDAAMDTLEAVALRAGGRVAERGPHLVLVLPKDAG